jgi:hypothetical protein
MALPKCIKTGSEEERMYRDAQMEIIELQMKLIWFHSTPGSHCISSFSDAYPNYNKNRKPDSCEISTVFGDIPIRVENRQGWIQERIKEITERIKYLIKIMDSIVEAQEAKIAQEKARLEDVFNLFNGVSK